MHVHIGRYPEEDEAFEREVKVVVHHYDVWAADQTLAMVIAPTLKLLKEKKQGAPKVDNEDVPRELRTNIVDDFNYKHEGKTDVKWFDRWDWVLDEMIWAFEEYQTDWEEKFQSGDIEIYWKDCDDKPGYKEMVKGPNDTFKYDTEAAKKHEDRIMNGIRLFAKYYGSLWD
jgi:hypothetical protein